MRPATTILSTGLFTVLFLLSVAFVAMRILGLGTFVVTGGSMEPAIHKGSLIIVEPVLPTEVAVGDVITFNKYDQTTSHRVVAITPTQAGPVFTTKGDANAAADPEPTLFPGRVGIVRAAIPLAGYVVGSLQAYWRLVLSLIAALVFFGCAAALIFQREGRAGVPASARGGAPLVLARAHARSGARLVLARATVAVHDVDAAWSAHLAWIGRDGARSVRAA